MIRHLLATEAHPQQGKLPAAAPHLLVSVRDAAEAALAKSLGVQWIDLKNPDSGSLGAADAIVARAVSAVLRSGEDSSQLMLSAAAGELREEPLQVALMLAQFFPLVKVGLSGMAGNRRWRTQFYALAQQLHSAGAQIVPVIYADHPLSAAPTPQEILSATGELEASGGRQSVSRFVLIDTYVKDGRRLLDWLAPPQITALCQQAEALGKHIVLAGSLAVRDLPQLLPLATAAIAVRGAVCTGDRRSGLCPRKVTHWLKLMQNR